MHLLAELSKLVDSKLGFKCEIGLLQIQMDNAQMPLYFVSVSLQTHFFKERSSKHIEKRILYLMQN